MRNNRKDVEQDRPSPRQILGAKIRAEEERFVKKHRRPFEGGYEVPARETVYKHLSEKFDMSPIEIRYYFTYARTCTHAWSQGACKDCPDYP